MPYQFQKRLEVLRSSTTSPLASNGKAPPDALSILGLTSFNFTIIVSTIIRPRGFIRALTYCITKPPSGWRIDPVK
jgi:hypothetical protein